LAVELDFIVAIRADDCGLTARAGPLGIRKVPHGATFEKVPRWKHTKADDGGGSRRRPLSFAF
jgi:hypothetical protein